MPRYDDYSREELVRLLEARDRRDATRFGLVWETNEVEREKALNGDFVALDFDAALSTPPTPGAEGEDAAWRNLIIEGDNFDALRFLRMAYAGRVKCICIDPPYNTGNRDFVYNDRYVDKDDAWRHSRWCEFMHQRLTLAKELLAEDGVIFVHIDDNEVHHLALLMNRIFGEANCVANLVWEKGKKGDSKLFSVTHEYVLVYVGNKASMLSSGTVWRRRKPGLDPVLEQYASLKATLLADHTAIRAEMMKWYRSLPTGHTAKAHKHYNWSDERGLYFAADFAGPDDGRESRPRYEILHPVTGRACKMPSTGWRWSEDRTAKALSETPPRIHFGPDETTIPCRKSYLAEIDSEAPTSVFYCDGRAATLEVERILEKGAFSFPKDIEVTRDLIQLVTKPNDIVLDFFAGSGTTGHAVLKANAADGGRRRFILVSSTEATEEEPEKNLCRDVCAERVRRVIAGYGEKAGLGGDFAYLRCRRIPEGDLMEIEHSQVWTALQLMHREGLTAYAPAALHWAQDAEGALCFVPQVKAGTAREILKRAEGLPGVIVYTWQPGLMADRLAGAEHIQVETIPQSLALKFGLGRGQA